VLLIVVFSKSKVSSELNFKRHKIQTLVTKFPYLQNAINNLVGVEIS